MKLLVLSAILSIFLSLFLLSDGQTRKNVNIFMQTLPVFFIINNLCYFQGLSLAERVQQLTEMTSKKAVLRFNGNKYRDFVKGAPRNYSVVIMFTAMAPSRQCQICRHASDEFTIVANSFRYSQTYSNKLFFAVVDFDDGSDVFLTVNYLITKLIML